MTDDDPRDATSHAVHAVQLPNRYLISDDRARLDMDRVHDAIKDAYWALGRPRALTDRSWANSLVFGVYDPEGRLVGFGRVLTDYALRAHMADVYVEPPSRGLGLAKALVGTMLAHPELRTVRRWTLTTADAQDLYGRFGFRIGQADRTWMTLEREPG